MSTPTLADSAPPSNAEPVSLALHSALLFDPGEVPVREDGDSDALVLNLEASLKVHTRQQFFAWAQGLLQSLIPHEILLCVTRDRGAGSYRVESFSMNGRPGLLGDLFLQDADAGMQLIKAWKARHFRPHLFDVMEPGGMGETALGKELRRVGATQVLAHGTHDVDAEVSSYFVFACAAGSIGPRHALHAQLAVPLLHGAWVRVQMRSDDRPGLGGTKPTTVARITSREREVLRWVSLGKSNIEIGVILGVSKLTVKNHVQKILRKLNVVNRAQATCKALQLRILGD